MLKECRKVKVSCKTITNCRGKIKCLYKNKTDLEKDITKVKEELDEAHRNSSLKTM